MVAAGAALGHACRHRLPGSRASVRHRASGRGAHGRSAASGSLRAGRAADRDGSPRTAATHPPRGRESVHALGWRTAPPVGRDRARDGAAASRARRANVRTGPSHVRRARLAPRGTLRWRGGDALRDARRGPRRLARRSDLAARRRSRRMRLLEPLVPDPRAPLARPHPIAKIVAALILMLALFITVDLVTSSVVVGALLVAARFSGLPPR